LANDGLRGAAWCRAHSDLVDGWLRAVFDQAVGDGLVAAKGLALVAVGGYGRAELAPQSDIDLLLLHDRRGDVADVADRIWYPVWDEGVKLGHSVATVAEALDVAANDLDSATALLSARLVAGDAALVARLADDARARWQRAAPRQLAALRARVDERHRGAGEVAFQLEPDVKDGRGGLRDVHSLHWAAATGGAPLSAADADALARAYDVLLDVRVELQRATGKPSNVLALQGQAAVAAALGEGDRRALMGRLAAAARTVAWISDEAWRQIGRDTASRRARRAAARTERLAPGVVRRGDEAALADQPLDALAVLRLAAAAAAHGLAVERASLERLAAEAPALPEPWPAEARALFVDLLAAGRSALPVIEALDQRGPWAGVLPEWAGVSARPQFNAYHRFTVDRHLLEATANAAARRHRVERPDLLVVGALLHDIGKGDPDRDHTEAGMGIARRAAIRMGFDGADVETLVALVEHHLLLPDVATRRDLDDPATIERVARAAGTVERLRLLAALTEADSLATGPSAWGHWKARMVAQLVERAAAVLDGGGPDHGAAFPSPSQLARLAVGDQVVQAHDEVVTVMTDDRPGVFSRVAGVLALNGLDVLAAAAYSDDGRALNEFRVVDRLRTETPWAKVQHDIEQALAGRLAVHARVAERARTYQARQAGSGPARVRFDNEASADATIIDVHAHDGVGVLYAITRALADLDLDIRSAKVQTLGHEAVDAFYVRDRAGDKVADGAALAEIERAILHALTA